MNEGAQQLTRAPWARVGSGGCRRPDWQIALAVGLLGAIALAVISSLMTRETVPHGDDLIYERMARDPLGTHTFPFAYRIGLPWLVHILPFGNVLSFRLLDWLATGVAPAIAYLLMRRLGSVRGLAAGLALCLALSPPLLLVSLRDGRNTDAATVALMMLGTLFAVERRTRALTLTLALGVLVREAQLFLIPLAYLLWAERPWDGVAAKRTLLCGLPALAVYIALHAAIPTVGEAQVPGYGGSLLGQRLDVIENGLGSLFTEARRMFSIYGPLWIAAPLALLRMSFARRGLMLVAWAVVSMTFALDWGRMILLAAPVFYPAGAYTLSRHQRMQMPALVIFALLIVGYAVYMQHSGLRTGVLDSPPPPYPVR
jgi:hypothetical protein